VAFTEGKVPAVLGQSARVFIQVAGEVPLAVPLSAVTAENGSPYVWVVDRASGKLKLTPVVVGAYTESSVPVLSGLKADDWVVAAGVQVLREGQVVRPVDRDNRAVDLAAQE
jgi:multidrug efflux system membrane fusion protein